MLSRLILAAMLFAAHKTAFAADTLIQSGTPCNNQVTYWDGSNWRCTTTVTGTINGTFWGVGVSSTVIKIATETVTNSSTMQNDDHLAIQISTSETWSFTGYMVAFTTSAVPNLKLDFTFPSGATANIGYWANNGVSSNTVNGALYLSGQSSGLIRLGASVDNPILFKGVIANGANSGTLQLRWAQNTANGAGVHSRPNGYISGVRIK